MKILLLSIAVLSLHSAFTQSCKDYYYMQNNKVVEMTMYNKKGKETGKNIYTISNVTNSGGTMKSQVNSEMFDPKGKTISRASNQVSCSGGVMMMDMKMFIPSTQQQQMNTTSATAQHVFIEYPANMKAGDKLNDGNFSMDFKMENGLAGNISIAITDRKVAAKETVSTTAGTWEAIKITYHSKIIMKIGIGIPVNMNVTEWYVPGFGVVKTEANGAKTEITAIR